MDQTGATTQQIIDESRMELAIAASSAERANKPRHLVLVSLVLLVGALAYLAWSYSARSATLVAVEGERTRARTTISLIDQYRAVDQAVKGRAFEPDSHMAGKIENLALDQYIEQAISVTTPDQGAGANTAAAQRKYSVTINNADLTKLLTWLVSTQTSDETKGLEIEQLQLRPGATLPATGEVGWSVIASFARWERKTP